LVTEPEELAIGLAVAETPPTSAARVGEHVIALTAVAAIA